MKKLLILVIVFLLFSSTAQAVPILWSGNNNHYDFIRTNITWHNAKIEAESLTYYGSVRTFSNNYLSLRKCIHKHDI